MLNKPTSNCNKFCYIAKQNVSCFGVSQCSETARGTRHMSTVSKWRCFARAPPTLCGSRDLQNIRDANLLSLMSYYRPSLHSNVQ